MIEILNDVSVELVDHMGDDEWRPIGQLFVDKSGGVWDICAEGVGEDECVIQSGIKKDLETEKTGPSAAAERSGQEEGNT